MAYGGGILVFAWLRCPVNSVGAVIVAWLHLRGQVEANIFDMPGLVSTRHALGGAFHLFF